ncbi:MAG: alkyl hydroperoxide reductase, partial [Actinomycetota bacterium]
MEGEPFVAIGVHSPKFVNERDPEMVRQAVGRYGVTHPVVVDSGMRVWSQFGVKAWPTLVLIDPEGDIVGTGSGEPVEQALLLAVRRVIEEGAGKGMLNREPLPLRAEPAPPGSLAYPGKVIADGERIVIADTGHNQVVVCDGEGRELLRVGSGEPGLADGPPGEARFKHPNGLAVVGATLYVADTGNHALRAVDLSNGEVVKVAGTGSMGRGSSGSGGLGHNQPLRSPWDLAWDGRRLYIAMAGSHQVWTFEPESGLVAPFAGTGQELRRDGPAETACFAQPSGLALLDETLYVADSEISSIRAISDLGGRPTVGTVCGSGDLFGFGDRDGVGESVRLQHPIGIAAGAGTLFVADTFNHKVKRVEP